MYYQGLKEFYNVIVKSKLLSKAECYSFQTTHNQNMKIKEMRIFK